MTNKMNKIKEPYAGWLDEFVTTAEASKITGVPKATLTTMRSRGGGSQYVVPVGTRLVRYQRRALFEWMFSGGVKSNTASSLVIPANDNEENV